MKRFTTVKSSTKKRRIGIAWCSNIEFKLTVRQQPLQVGGPTRGPSPIPFTTSPEFRRGDHPRGLNQDRPSRE